MAVLYLASYGPGYRAPRPYLWLGPSGGATAGGPGLCRAPVYPLWRRAKVGVATRVAAGAPRGPHAGETFER